MPLLNWLTRDSDLKTSDQVPYRLLKEEPEHSYGEESENLLVQGDNLEALKALLPFYAGRVKCIYIDPPYNTGTAFEHYDDALEHSKWLSMMYPRLEILRDLLSEEGSIWVSIDDREGHYLKVILDEVFGRKNFLANLVWQKRTSRENRKAIGSAHDHIFVYGKKPASDWKKHRNLLPDNGKGYANPDSDPRGPWRSIPFSAQGFRANQMYKITTPTGLELDPPTGRCWGATEPEFIRLRDLENKVYWPKKGNGKPRIKKFAAEDDGLVPMTWWTAAAVWRQSNGQERDSRDIWKKYI
jgi:adenine-specific DNA-methyltransferase